jgi:hypothetical protein
MCYLHGICTKLIYTFPIIHPSPTKTNGDLPLTPNILCVQRTQPKQPRRFSTNSGSHAVVLPRRPRHALGLAFPPRRVGSGSHARTESQS